MKVLLLTPPFAPNFMRNARWDVMGISGSQWYPIYLAYCTGLLEREGHETRLLDAQVDGLSREKTYQIAKDFHPQLTVVYFSTKALRNDIEVAEAIHDLTGSEIILVGPSASINSTETLKVSPKINLMARGEFDFTVLEVANNVPWPQIDGLLWKDSEGEVHTNSSREPVPDEELDKFPFVTDIYRRHLNIRNYHQSGHKHPYVDLFTGRGCAWGLCTFCLWPNTINKGAGYRKRKISNVIEELRFVREALPYIKEIFIQDDVLPKDRAIELSEAILESKLKVCWSCYARAELDFATLKMMKKAGCRTMHVGYESSNPQILKNIKKGVSPERMVEFTKNANKAGLFIVADFITGSPGETVETIKATIEWAKRLPVQRYTITLPKPYPETPFYEYLLAHGYLRDGRPNYPNLSTEDIYRWNKWSVKQVYFSLHYFFRMITKPYEWGRLARSARFLFRSRGEILSELGPLIPIWMRFDPAHDQIHLRRKAVTVSSYPNNLSLIGQSPEVFSRLLPLLFLKT